MLYHVITQLAESGKFLGVGEYDIGPKGSRTSSPHPASLRPTPQFRGVHLQLSGQITQSPFVRSKCTDVFERAAQSQTRQQLTYHRAFKSRLSTDRFESFRIQMFCDLSGAIPFGPQVSSSFDEFVVIPQRFITLDWPGQVVLAGVSTLPMHFQAHVFGIVSEVDHDSINQAANDFFAIN